MMDSIADILESIDTLAHTRLDERQVAGHIGRYIEANKNTVDETFHWEKAAFEFYANYRNKETGWGTYFGPMFIWPDGEGHSVEYPSIQMLSEQILDYYAKRATEAVNPLLVARYAGLVHDFQRRVTGRRIPYAIRLLYINALIDTANGDYQLTPVYTFEKLKQALRIALQIKNKGLASKAKDALIAFEERHARDQYAGLWGISIELLVLQNRSQNIISAEEEESIVLAMQERFDRLSASEEDRNAAFRNLEHAGNYLCKYYRLMGDIPSFNATSQRLVDSIEDAIKDMPQGAKAGAEYERLYELCEGFGLKARARDYLKRVRECGQKAHDEMKVFQYEASLSTKELEVFAAKILKGNSREILQRIAYSFVPNFAVIKQQIDKDFRKNPLEYIVTKKLVDRKGRAKAVLRPYREDAEGHIFHAAAGQMKMKAALALNFVLHQLITKMEFNSSTIIAALDGSPVVDSTRFSIIEAAVGHYLKGDYLVAVHLLVPQIEEALRNTLEVNGGVILNYNEDGSSFVKTLDSVLRDDIVVRVLTEEIAGYFRLLLTDQKGWNLRNDICHGLAEPEEFNKIVADRLIHALLCIANIRFQEEKQD
jgi:hypothetical protein